MDEKPAAVRYVISEQGNRNLVLQRSDNETFESRSRAEETAWRKASERRVSYTVFEVKVTALAVYRPQPALKEEL